MACDKFISSLFIFLLLGLGSCAKPLPPQVEAEQADLSCSYFYFLWGSHAEFHGDFTEAIEAYEKALICDPEAVYVKEKLPTLLLKMGELEKATVWLSAAIVDYPNNNNYKLLLANLYIQQDKTDAAIDLYLNVLQKDPVNENVSLQLAILYIQQKDYIKAENLLEKVLETSPSSYYPTLFLARVHKHLERIEKAIAGYEKALVLNWSSDIAYELGYLYVNNEMYEDGLRIFTTITENDQLDERAALTRIQTLLDLKLNDEALQGLRNTRLFSKNPDKIDLVISKVLLRQEQIEEARAILERLTRESDLSEPLYMLALLDFQKENYQSSLNYLNPITPDSAEFEESVYLRTRIYQKINQPQKAMAMLEKYIADAQTRSPLFYALLSSLHQELDDRDSALALMDKATQLYPDNYQLCFEYGIMLEQSNRKAEAVVQMQKVLELDPENADALNFIGYTWADQNINLDKALEYILKAIKLKPNNGYILDSLGWVYYRLKEYDKALKWLNKSLKLKPDDPNIYDHLGDTYNALGLKDEALKAYQSAFDMYDDEVKKNSVKAKMDEL